MKNTTLTKPRPDFNWDQMDRLVTEHLPDRRGQECMPPGACTVDQFADHRKVTRSTAARQLNELVKRGVLDKDKLLLNKSYMNVYWPIVK